MDDGQLECGECRQRYAKGELCPRTLFCGHTFCTRCLDQAITSGNRRCLSCSRPFIALSATQLLTDFSILRRVSSRTDDAPSPKNQGTSNSTSNLGNSLKSSSSLRSIGTFNYNSKLRTSTSSSSSLQTLKTSSHDDSKPSKYASLLTSLETLGTSNYPSKLRNDVSSSSSLQSLDTSSYKSKTLNTDSTPSSLQTDNPRIVSCGAEEPSSVTLIGTTSLSYSSLTPRVSSAPATTRSLYGSSDTEISSSSLKNVATLTDGKIHTDEADSPRSSTLRKISSEDLPMNRQQTTLTYKFPTIRTRLAIGNQDSRLYRSPSLESDSTDTVQSETSVVGLHDKLKKSSSLPVTALELPSTYSSRTATKQSIVASVSRPYTSSDESFTKASPCVLSSEFKSTSANARSRAQFPLTSRVTRIANQDQSLTSSKITDRPDMAINGPVPSPPTGSVTLPRSVSSLSKYDKELQNISKDKQTQQREADINASHRELDSDISGLRNTNNSEVEYKGKASSTPSHVLNMCRSITKNSRKQKSSEEASSIVGADTSSSNTQMENPETLFTSRSGYLKNASSSARLRSSNTVLTTTQAQSVISDNDREKKTESNTGKKPPTVPLYIPTETGSSSVIRIRKTTVTKEQSSDDNSSEKEALEQEAADPLRQTDAGKNFNTQNRRGDEPPRADLSQPTNTEEFTSSVIGTARRSNPVRRLSRSMSTGSEKPDESGTRTRPAASRDIGRLARSSSLSARLLARSSFASETINEEDEKISAESRRSTRERSDDRGSAINKFDTKSLNHPPTSLRARLLSRTSFLSRTIGGEEDAITYQRPGEDSVEDIEKASKSSDSYTKARKSRLEIQKTKSENDCPVSGQINSSVHSAHLGKAVEGQKQPSVSQSQEILMRINSCKRSEVECVDRDCVDVASDPVTLKPTLPTSPPPGTDNELYTDNVFGSATTSHSTGSGIQQGQSDNKARDEYTTSYENVLSNRRTPSNAIQLDHSISYSRIIGTDKLAELHVGSVPSIQSEDGDDEDTEEDGTPHRHEVLTQVPTENTHKGTIQLSRSTQHEVKFESVKADGTKLLRGRRENACNEQRDDHAAVQSDNVDDPGIRPASSAGCHKVAGSDSDAQRDNTILADRNQKINNYHPMAKDSVQDIWRARNARLRYSLTARSKRNHSTADEATDVDAGGNNNENQRRSRHQLRNTTRTNPPLMDLRTDSSNRKLNSLTPNLKGTPEVSDALPQSMNVLSNDESNDSVPPVREQQSAPRREAKQIYTSVSSKQFPDVDDSEATLGSPYAAGRYIASTACVIEAKIASDTTRRGQTKEHRRKKYNATTTHGTGKDSASLQISGSDTDEVDGPRTGSVPSSSFSMGKYSPHETNLGTVQSESPLPNIQQVSAIPRTPPDGSYRANYIDSAEGSVREDISSTFTGHHIDSKNDTVPGDIYSAHETRPGVSLCGIHGSLLHVYCKTCDEWACDGCLGVRHQQPPRGRCQIISAPDAVMHMKVSQTEFLSSKADTLEHFREELRKLVTECDNSILEHEVNMKHLEMQLREQVTLLKGIESMKTLAQQKLKKVDYWEDLLRQNAHRIRQSSSSEEIQSAVFINRTSILANIIEGVSIPEFTMDSS